MNSIRKLVQTATLDQPPSANGSPPRYSKIFVVVIGKGYEVFSDNEGVVVKFVVVKFVVVKFVVVKFVVVKFVVVEVVVKCVYGSTVASEVILASIV